MHKAVRLMLAGALLGCLGSAALALPVLVSQYPWGENRDVQNFTQVFGASGFTFHDSFAAASPAAVFTPGNSFVMLEGGELTAPLLQDYLDANATTILPWVRAGSALLIQSAGVGALNDLVFNGVTLEPARLTRCGALTAEGLAALDGAPATECGLRLAHDIIVEPTDLTVFMRRTQDIFGRTVNQPIVAGGELGCGYVMYSGLTNSQFHDAGSSLVNSLLRFTSSQAGPCATPVPEPGTGSLSLAGLAGLLAWWRLGGPGRRRSRSGPGASTPSA